MAFNLQGIIRKSSTNITNEFNRLAYASQNIANMNTNGYKAVRFEEIIDADGTVHGVERTDFSQGEYYITKNPLDVAIQGAGFIPVTTVTGEIRYTRDGSFMTDKDGYLITKNGDLVGSGIKIDASAEKTEIRSNGDVYSYKTLGDKGEYVGTIPVVQFQNPEGLINTGGNNFSASEKAGEMKLVENHDCIKQYGIEKTNFDLTNEIYMISRINASILASSKLMSAVNKMYQSAMSINQ